MKKLFIDVETTGVDPMRNAIHTMACIFEVSGKIVESKTFTMCPDYMGALSAEDLDLAASLEISGSTLEQVITYEKAHVVAREFVNFLGRHINLEDDRDKCFFIAYNAKFDFDMFMSWMKHSCMASYVFQNIYTPPICVLSKSADAFKVIRKKFPNLKLSTLAKLFGITLDAHNAESDVAVAREIYNRLEDATTIDYDNI